MNRVRPALDSFITAKPENKLLRKYIAYYYFHQKNIGNPTEYLFYPHIKNGLTIYKNSKTSFSKFRASTVPDSTIDYTYLYSGIELHAISVAITPPFDKIGIAFQPLGLNYFVDQPLSDLIDIEKSIAFDYFRPTLNPVLDKVYGSEKLEYKVQLLDNYFLSQLIGFRESRLEEAIRLLTKAKEKYSVDSLAKELSISRKTLLRIFQKHLNCSVKDYIHIVQFRKAVETYQSFQKKPQLGEIAHANNYYDQSDFIKRFKKITGFNPKRFFKDIIHLGSEDTFWTFVK